MNPSRRGILGAAVAGLTGALVARAEAGETPAVPPDATKVLGPPSTGLGERSPFEDSARLKSGVVTGPSPAPIQSFYGTITPTDLQFQRHHGGIAYIDPAAYKLLVHGLVDGPMAFTLDELKRFPAVTRVCFLECSGNGRQSFRAPKPEMSVQDMDGLIANLEFTGVPLKTVLKEVGVKPEAKWMVAEGGDASVLARSIPIEKALDDAILVYAANGEALRPAYGYPVRLMLPGWEANACIKWLRRLELRETPMMAKDETAKYSDPLADGTVRTFSFVVDCKSIITSPTFPQKLAGPGWTTISGLAWSGRGRIERVDVSTDGGKSWTQAEILGTPQPKAAVRFQLPWSWDGKEAVLMSRATDETGYTQPTVGEFKAVRGAGTDYHFNAIRSWRVAPDGSVFFRPDPEGA